MFELNSYMGWGILFVVALFIAEIITVTIDTLDGKDGDSK